MPSGSAHGYMFCRKCGKFLNPGVRFCNGCGAPTAAPAAQTQEVVSHRCESCGAMMSQVAPNRFQCDYCGSQWVPEVKPVEPAQPYQAPVPPYQQPPVEQQVKDAGEDFLDAIYSAAKRLFK